MQHTGIRPGGVKHAGHAVESGTRYIIGGFCMHQHKMEPVRMLLNTVSAGSDENSSTTVSETASSTTIRKALEAAVALNPACDTAYSLLANHYESVEHNPAKAQKVLEYCLEHVHPQSGEVAYALGSLVMAQQNYQRAAECMELCLAADCNDVEAAAAAARAYAGLGNHIDKEKAMYELIIHNPGASVAAKASAYANLGVVHQGTDREIEYYQKALSLEPELFAPRYSLACAYTQRKDWKSAIQTFQQAVDHADTDDNAMKALRSLYRASGYWMQSDTESPAPTSPEDMMKRFQEIMGVQYYQRLDAARAGK